MRHAVKLAEEM